MTWAPDYLTLSELKGWLRIDDTVDDAELAVAITAASRAVDRCCGRQFGQVAVVEERFYVAAWDRRCSEWYVELDDLADDAGLTVVDDAGATFTDYTLEPRNAVAKGKVWTRVALGSGTPTGALSVTAQWGWPSVPDTVKLATRLQASRFMARRDSPFGIAGSPDQGSELRLLARVDPDVELMLSDYRRRWYAA